MPYKWSSIRFFYNGDRPAKEQRNAEILPRAVNIIFAAVVTFTWFLAFENPITAAFPLIPAYLSLLWDVGRVVARIRSADSKQLLGCGIMDAVLSVGSLVLMALTIVANNVIHYDDNPQISAHPGNIVPAIPLTVSLAFTHFVLAGVGFVNWRKEPRTTGVKDAPPSTDTPPKEVA